MVKIPVSIGELIDKITILQIKSEFSDSEFVKKELKELLKIETSIAYNSKLKEELYRINKKLWAVEDELRLKEKNQDFGEIFIGLARDVYILNDKRAEIKKQINEETNSEYKEIKFYNN